MKRHTTEPRPDWVKTVEGQGLLYHTVDKSGDYWDESAYYEFTKDEIDALEAATYELNRLSLEAVQHVLDENRLDQFLIPPEYHQYIRDSWERDEHTIYGRFDLSYDGKTQPKMLEYNADTPTALLEAAVVQWHWLQEKFSDRGYFPNQFNSIHERLIEAWKSYKDKTAGVMYFAAMAGIIEDYMTVNYLRDTAIQAGWETEYIDVENIGWNESRKVFTDLNENPIENMFKLYPWEWMQRDEFGQKLQHNNTRWLEAPWKAVLSNKAILPILWELFPDHPNLLRSQFTPIHGKPYVQKPILSREGANIQIFEHGQVLLKTEGPYNGPAIYQQLWELPEFDGNHPVLGTWMVNGWACGMGIREDKTLITGNTSRFVPHVFGTRPKYGS
jgi:glutathionylspermidine synthase